MENTYRILWWTVAAVVFNKINTCKKSLISFSPSQQHLMKSELRYFTYTVPALLWLWMFWVMLLHVAACASAEISNRQTQHLQEFSHRAPFSLWFLDLALNNTSAVEFLTHFHNLLAQTWYIHPSSVYFNVTGGSFKSWGSSPRGDLVLPSLTAQILQSVNSLHLAAYK